MSSKLLVPVILCGGSGTRLWPLSRQSFPKQYLSLSSKNNFSLLQKTFLRISKFKNIQSPILICNEEHRFIVAEQMRQIGTKPTAILLEPVGKNTCPAITLAALKSLEIWDNANLLVLSSDHDIREESNFLDAIENGLKYSENKDIVTFGVVPTSPEVGYGYIKANSPFNLGAIEGSKISEFIEKPNLKTAKIFIKDKRYTWNSGIFMFKAKTILDEIQKNNPQIIKYCKSSFKDNKKDLDFIRIEKRDFINCPNISIDIAVMEKTQKGIVLPLDAGWNDIGSWKAVWDISEKDSNGNSITGDVIIKNTKNSYIRSDNRLIATIGINELIVVETQDAILVANQKESQEVKNIVEELKLKKIAAGRDHLTIYRPWGSYTSIENGKNWQVKFIEVKPCEQLSLQLHNHRSEHWIIVSGSAKVEINNKIMDLHENQSVFIPLGSKHRLSNPGKYPLKLIEVQSGSYLGEDDIVRFEDKYGRNPTMRNTSQTGL